MRDDRPQPLERVAVQLARRRSRAPARASGSRARCGGRTGRAGPRAAGTSPPARSSSPSRSRGTELGSGWLMPSTVTWRSAIPSSSADCAFGSARLISSTRRTLAKIGPGRNSKRRVLRVPDREPGDVGRLQVRRALDPRDGRALDRAAERPRQHRLGGARARPRAGRGPRRRAPRARARSGRACRGRPWRRWPRCGPRPGWRARTSRSALVPRMDPIERTRDRGFSYGTGSTESRRRAPAGTSGVLNTGPSPYAIGARAPPKRPGHTSTGVSGSGRGRAESRSPRPAGSPLEAVSQPLRS